MMEAFPASQQGQAVLHAQKGAPQIDVDHPVPLFHGELLQGAEEADPRVVAQDVQLFALLVDAIHQPPNLIRLRNVRRNEGGRTSRLPDPSFTFGSRFFILLRDVDVGPFPGQHRRHRAADTLPSAGHDRRLIHKSPFFQSLSTPLIVFAASEPNTFC